MVRTEMVTFTSLKDKYHGSRANYDGCWGRIHFDIHEQPLIQTENGDYVLLEVDDIVRIHNSYILLTKDDRDMESIADRSISACIEEIVLDD